MKISSLLTSFIDALELNNPQNKSERKLSVDTASFDFPVVLSLMDEGEKLDVDLAKEQKGNIMGQFNIKIKHYRK